MGVISHLFFNVPVRASPYLRLGVVIGPWRAVGRRGWKKADIPFFPTMFRGWRRVGRLYIKARIYCHNWRFVLIERNCIAANNKWQIFSKPSDWLWKVWSNLFKNVFEYGCVLCPRSLQDLTRKAAYWDTLRKFSLSAFHSSNNKRIIIINGNIRIILSSLWKQILFSLWKQILSSLWKRSANSFDSCRNLCSESYCPHCIDKETEPQRGCLSLFKLLHLPGLPSHYLCLLFFKAYLKCHLLWKVLPDSPPLKPKWCLPPLYP